MSWFKPVALILLLSGFTACQPLPQPFKPEVKGRAASPLVRPAGETSLFVAPVAGLPAEQSTALADALADALAEREVPASSTARSVLSSILTVAVEPRSGEILWRWNKRQPDNGQDEGPEQRIGLNGDLLAAGDPAAMQHAAKAIADVIAGELNESNLAVAANATPPKLSVLECDGAPGDGNRSLRQAMREILILTGQPPVADPASAEFLVSCNVRVWAEDTNSERVTIEWALLAADGRKLGEVNQANRIPRGQLSQAWGNTAHIIAQGGWQGLSRILEAQGRPVAVRLPPNS